jgi:hypothetical protein
MAKDRKHTQQRSKGERLNWSSASQGNEPSAARNALTGRFLAPATPSRFAQHQDGQAQRNDNKQLVP